MIREVSSSSEEGKDKGRKDQVLNGEHPKRSNSKLGMIV